MNARNVTPSDCDLPADREVIPLVAHSDGELVVRARGGDLDAFAVLIARYRDRFVRYAKHMLGTREDAEEAVQDAFVRAFRALEQCEPDRFGAWTYRILVNRCRTSARRRRWWSGRVAELDNANEVGVPHPAANQEHREEIDRALTRLSSDQREAFLLKYVDDMSYEEISSVTGASVSALKMRVKRACERLRETLGDSR